MLKVLYIILICYMPILDKYIPATNFGAGIPDIGPVRFFSYLLVFVFGIEAAIKKQARFFSKWTGFITVFSIIVLASISWSNYSYTPEVIQDIFNTVLIPLIVVIIGLNLFAEKENIDGYIKNLLVAAFILSIISIYQMLFGKSLILGEFRSAATLGNPNLLAVFLVIVIPCLIYAIEKQIVSKKIGWILSASVVGGIICTVSRKGMATAILAYCIYYFYKRKFKNILALGFVVMTLIVALSGYAVISGRFGGEAIDKQFAGKFAMTYAGWQMYKKSPLIGLGYKGYYDNFGKYFPWSSKVKYDAHNIFITALTNYGLLGFIPFLCIFLYPLSAARKTLKIDDSENPYSISKDLAIICISSVLPFMLSGWFAGGLFYSPVVIMLLYTNVSLFLSYEIT